MNESKIETVNIGGISFHDLSLSKLIQKLDDIVSKKKKAVLAFSNPEFVLEAKKKPELFHYLNNVSFNLADGAGIVLASKILNKKPLKERVTGTDFLPALIGLSHQKGYKLFFLGGKPGIAEKAREELKKSGPNADVVGTYNGFFSNEEESVIIEKINSLSPDFLMVCLGNPRQEEWIERNFKKLNVNVIFGNGGALDFFSSNVKRAPLWMQNNGLEWLFRLSQDFSINRLRRQGRLIQFPFLILRQYCKQKLKRGRS